MFTERFVIFLEAQSNVGHPILFDELLSEVSVDTAVGSKLKETVVYLN